MYGIHNEIFLYDFFLFDATIGRHCDRKKLFRTLADVYGVQKEEADQLFVLSEKESVRDVVSDDDFKRYKRIKQYNELIGNEPPCGNEEDAIIEIKGNALVTAAQNGLQTNVEFTDTLAIKALMNGAETGKVIALRMLGVLLCEGILVAKDTKAGVQNLVKSMRWADIPSCLAMLKYSDDDKNEIMAMLNASVKDTMYEYIANSACKRYGITNRECSEEVLLIRKAFGASKFDPNVYNPMCDRVAYSKTISIKDRQKIILSDFKELVSETCDLPLHVRYSNLSFDEAAFASMAIIREKEQQSIKTGLLNSDLRTMDNYRPLCLCSDSDYVQEAYVSAITKSLKSAQVERIDVAGLREFDFEHARNNFFLRSINEDKNNVCILVFKGDISDPVMEVMQEYLKTAQRRKFHLTRLAIALDVSSVLPICICDIANAKRLKGCVDKIELAPIEKNEKPQIINDMLAQKCKSYRLKTVTIEDSVVDKLIEIPVEAIDRIVDKAIRDNRPKGENVKLTMETLKTYLNKRTDGNAYGFGGVINESK